jgi:hypothetical protein
MSWQRRHPTGLLIALEGFVATTAWAGAAALAGGGLDILAEQLPGPGRLVGAVGLAVCIAVPTSIAAVALVQRRSWSPRLAKATAVVLAGWLLGQTLFVGLSALQPAYLLLAGVIAGLAVELQRAVVVEPPLRASPPKHAEVSPGR